MSLSPELETLDQLCGGDLELHVVRRLFADERRFARAVAAMLADGEVRLLRTDGAEVPRWRWTETLATESAAPGVRLSITDKGVRRIC